MKKDKKKKLGYIVSTEQQKPKNEIELCLYFQQKHSLVVTVNFLTTMIFLKKKISFQSLVVENENICNI